MAADKITLTVPARDEYARTVRMTAATLVARSEASIDLHDDIRIAVEEAYIYACELGASKDQLTFEFSLDESSVDVRIGPIDVPADMTPDPAADHYSHFILESVCDEFETLTEEGAMYIRLVKRLA